MVTVVIPTCNRNELLAKTVLSVLNQSSLPKAIIIVNNGTGKVELPFDSNLIKIIDIMPFAGVSQARNFGAYLAKSEYIAFLDDDDMWETEYLEKAQEIIREESPDAIIARKDILYDGQIKPYKNANGKINMNNLLVKNPGVGGQNTIVKRSSFIAAGGYDVKLVTSEDKSLIIEFMLKNYQIVTAPHMQAIIRKDPRERLTNSKNMRLGLRMFLSKYSHLMTFQQRFANVKKIIKHDYHYFISRWLKTGSDND